MSDESKLKLIKLVHTVIWFIMALASIYILYAGITKTKSLWLWISIGLLCFESLILALNKWTCPFTPMAMKYTTDRADNFDIYIPNIVAKYNKVIFGTIFIIGLALVIYNMLAI